MEKQKEVAFMTRTTTMTRLDNWPNALNQYIGSVKDKKFEMGSFDCCIFVAGACKAITGEDPMKEFRGKYNEDTYKDALKTIGAGSLYKTLVKTFGKSTHPAMGQRGDIAYLDGRIGVVTGRTAIFLYEEGFGIMNVLNVDRIFKVGR